MDRALVFGHDENADVNMNDGSPTRGNPIKTPTKRLEKIDLRENGKMTEIPWIHRDIESTLTWMVEGMRSSEIWLVCLIGT
jgi:hypothetical protein